MVAPKLPRKLSFPILVNFILVASAVATPQEQSVNLNNRIAACNKVSVEKVFRHNNLVLADASISSIKSAGYCGCKSAVLSYSVRIDEAGKKQQGEYGRFLSFTSGKYTFVIDRDYGKKATNREYNLSIQCAPPD